FYSLVAVSLAVLVCIIIAQDVYRGGRVFASHTGEGLLAGVVTLARRNTRRYGGYIVHFGVVVIVVGIAGVAFNQDKEQEMGYGDKMNIGAYTLLCRSYTQEDNPNYGSESAILDVSKGGRHLTTMYPERRFSKASQTTATIVANHTAV